MKLLLKTLAFIFFSTFFVTANGQITKNNWLVGGSGSFYSYNNQYTSAAYSNEAEYTRIDIGANVGYFVADKVAFGLRPTFSSFAGRVTSTGGGSTNAQRYFLGPFGRYYFLTTDKQTNIVTDVSYQFGLSNNSGQRGNLSAFSAMAGPVVFFNSSVGMEFLIGYKYSKDDIENASTEIRKGFQVTIGFQIHLEK